MADQPASFTYVGAAAIAVLESKHAKQRRTLWNTTSGRIVGKPSVARSCGHKILDDEALRMVKVAAPFAPLPNNADKDVMVFVVPIDFKLEG